MRQQAKQEYAHLRQKILDELSHFPELSEEIKELLKEVYESDVTTGHRRIAGHWRLVENQMVFGFRLF